MNDVERLVKCDCLCIYKCPCGANDKGGSKYPKGVCSRSLEAKLLRSEIERLKSENKNLRVAARMINKRHWMKSGSLEMHECDEFCASVGLEPWKWIDAPTREPNYNCPRCGGIGYIMDAPSSHADCPDCT